MPVVLKKKREEERNDISQHGSALATLPLVVVKARSTEYTSSSYSFFAENYILEVCKLSEDASRSHIQQSISI